MLYGCGLKFNAILSGINSLCERLISFLCVISFDNVFAKKSHTYLMHRNFQHIYIYNYITI